MNTNKKKFTVQITVYEKTSDLDIETYNGFTAGYFEIVGAVHAHISNYLKNTFDIKDKMQSNEVQS